MLRGVAGIAIAFFAGQALGAGALAVDTNQGARWGVSHSYANMNGAEQRALKECGSGCSIGGGRANCIVRAWACNSK